MQTINTINSNNRSKRERKFQNDAVNVCAINSLNAKLLFECVRLSFSGQGPAFGNDNDGGGGGGGGGEQQEFPVDDGDDKCERK